MSAVTTGDDWQDFAACRGADPDLFFPAERRGRPGQQQAEQAKEVCTTCTVRDACLDAAIARDEHHGIWGGLTRPERNTVRARRRRAQGLIP